MLTDSLGAVRIQRREERLERRERERQEEKQKRWRRGCEGQEGDWVSQVEFVDSDEVCIQYIIICKRRVHRLPWSSW